jgi:hypothetical protein
MNSNKEFDELARQKLAERSFPFEEGNWLAAQQVLQAQRGGNKRAFWLVGALALLLAGAGAWWWMQDEALVEKGGITAVEMDRTNPGNDAEGNSTALQATTSTALDSSEEVTHAEMSEEPVSIPDSRADRTQPSHGAEAVGNPAKHAGTTQGSTPGGTRATLPMRDGISPQTAALSTVQGTSSIPDQLAAIQEAPTMGTVAEIPHSEPDPFKAALDVMPQEPLLDRAQLPVTPIALSEQTVVPENEALAPAAEPSAQSVDTNERPSTEMIEPATEIADTILAELPKDSTDALEPQLLELPLIAQRSPWEIGVLGGIFSTTSNFRSANSADWNDAVTRQRSASVGAEFMRMSNNFGVGFGVHYGTYAERIAVGELSNTQVDIDRFWYLRPVDTTILVISDTLFQGGSPYYVGESVTTTVNVLTQGFDTTTTITQQRAARELYNRVSYMEIPLLLDAHLVQGRWSIGLRCGPTLGILSGRRGALPNNSNDGYTEFSDQAFRELVLGYTARAYVRYRWNAAWSIGLEPAIRGQVMNSLNDGPLDRRSSAFGGMLSLSYRLR